MYERFFSSLREKVSFGPLEEAQLAAVLRRRQLERREQLLEHGSVSTWLAFVSSGALHSCSIDEKGGRHVLQFAFPGWWISDLYSLLTGEPSKLFIEALEPSEVLLIHIDDHNRLLDVLPAYERYMRILYQNAYVALQRRLEGTLGVSAEQRYSTLLEQSPDILQRVPQLLIASFLGVTPETLSRIRRQLSR